jgi:hypothetical protein
MALKFTGGKAATVGGPPTGWTAAQWAEVPDWAKSKIRGRIPVPDSAGDLRHAILELGDKVYGAEDNVAALSPDVKAAFNQLKTAYKVFNDKLSQKYVWDSY